MTTSETIPTWLPEPVKKCITDETHLVEFDEQTGECEACGFRESAEWDFEIDQQGPIENSSLPADTNGWSREDVWVGEEVSPDTKIGSSYSAAYRKGHQALDLIYYVTGHHGCYEVELAAHNYEVDGDGEHVPTPDEDYDYSHPYDFAYTEFEPALRAARNGAMGDERFKLG